MKATALIGLSSPGNSQNYFSKLLKLTVSDTDKSLWFKVVDCLLVCKACQKLDKAEQLQCQHVKSGAHWLSVNKSKRLKRLYSTDPATALRELMGIITDDNDQCYDKNDILKTFDLPHVGISSAPKQICISCDPCGGGASKMAITSGYYASELNFVVTKIYLLF